MLSHYIIKLHHTPSYCLTVTELCLCYTSSAPTNNAGSSIPFYKWIARGREKGWTWPLQCHKAVSAGVAIPAQKMPWISAFGLLWRDKSGREPGARCWLLALAFSVTTCSGTGAIKSVTPESGAAQASPQRAVSANAILSRKLGGRRRHPESKLYLPYIRKSGKQGPVGTGKELTMPTTV